MSKKINNGGVNNEHIGDLLFDYMDNTLDERERVRVREHLKSCVDCRANYEELRATQQLLQSLPDMPPPRAFTLTPEMVSANAKPSFWQRLFAPANAQRYAWGSGLSFTALALMLFSSALLGQSNASMSVPMAAMMNDTFSQIGSGLSESAYSMDDELAQSLTPDQSAAIPPMAAETIDADAAARQSNTQTSSAFDTSDAAKSASTSAPMDSAAGGASGGVSPAEAAPTAIAASNPAEPPSGVAYDTGMGASTTTSPRTVTNSLPYGVYANPTHIQGGNVQPESQANTAGPSVEAIVMLSLVVLGTVLAVGALLARRT